MGNQNESEEKNEIEGNVSPEDWVTFYSIDELKSRVRFKEFDECIRSSLTVTELKEICLFAGKKVRYKEKKADCVEKVFSIAKEKLITAMNQNNFVICFAFFKEVSRVSYLKKRVLNIHSLLL